MDEEEKVEGHEEVRGEIGSTSLAAVGLGVQGGAIAARAIKFFMPCLTAAVFSLPPRKLASGDGWHRTERTERRRLREGGPGTERGHRGGGRRRGGWPT